MTERKVRFQQWAAKRAGGGGGGPHAAAKLPIGFADSPVQVYNGVESQKQFYEPVGPGAGVTAQE
eukprot:5638961-Pyramimonas_sp.AAC.1